MATANARMAGTISTVLSTYIPVYPAMPKVMNRPPRTDSKGETMPRRDRVIINITSTQIIIASTTRRPIS